MKRKKYVGWRSVWIKFRRWDEICWQAHGETPNWKTAQNKIQQLVELNLSDRSVEKHGDVGSTGEEPEKSLPIKIHRIK